MNTKIVMQRLAKAASSKAKESFAFIKTYSGGLHSIGSDSLPRFCSLPLTSSRQRRFLPYSTPTPEF